MPTICSIQHLLSKMLPQHTKRTTKFNSTQFNYFYNNFYSTKFFFRCDILNAIASVYCEREKNTNKKKLVLTKMCDFNPYIRAIFSRKFSLNRRILVLFCRTNSDRLKLAFRCGDETDEIRTKWVVIRLYLLILVE